MNLFKVDGKFNLGDLIISFLVTLGGGIAISMFIKDSPVIYEGLDKPWFSPPAEVFPIVWIILYSLMSLAFYRVYMKSKEGIKTNSSLTFYMLQLVLNFLWVFIFFRFKLYGIAFIELCVLFIFIIITIIKFFKVDKVSGIIMIPYAIWVIIAGLLNFYIWMLNEM